VSDTPNNTVDTVDVMRIMEMIPHRYPMLLVDRVENLVSGERATGVKCVTINEGFFQGHFPAKPVMPGVLIVEAMAQTAAVLAVETLGEEAEGKLVYFMGIQEAKFRKPVVPGDVLHMHLSVERGRGRVWRLRGEAMVGDELAAEANITAMIADA